MTAYLVVIDMQQAFSRPDSAWFVPDFAQIVDPVRELVGRYGSATLFTRYVPVASPAGSWRDYQAAYPPEYADPGSSQWQLDEAMPGREHAVLDAATFSKWTDELVGRVGPEPTLVLCGVATECCVASTALAAADAGARVYVVADACAGATPQAHEAALELMRGYAPMIEVVDVRRAATLGSAWPGQ